MLIVEDGTGKVDAESFATVAEADARLAALGMTIWNDNMSGPEKEQALRRAAEYMEQKWRLRWKGVRSFTTQALSWPRAQVVVEDLLYPFDAVPTAIRNANIDLALPAAKGELIEDPKPVVIRQKLGPLERQYDPNSLRGPRFMAQSLLVAPFLKMTQGTVIR
jgi:hypothetical protein